MLDYLQERRNQRCLQAEDDNYSLILGETGASSKAAWGSWRQEIQRKEEEAYRKTPEANDQIGCQ